ncbi:hypothetical protein [Rufibacter immobilis]|uniref:hypothetical protein n=1 Tax=Rufibacter immobilis TaxID=1348778 RepID=UPI0016087A16|nr:hypothetical protein [Rufibacter immobilis]
MFIFDSAKGDASVSFAIFWRKRLLASIARISVFDLFSEKQPLNASTNGRLRHFYLHG